MLELDIRRFDERQFLHPFHVIGDLSERCLQLRWHLVRDLGHNAATGDIDEIMDVTFFAFDFPKVDRHLEPVTDDVECADDAQWNPHRPGKIVRRPDRNESDCRTILKRCEPRDDFVQCPVSTCGDDEVELGR